MNDDDRPSGHERCGGITRSGRPCRLPAGHATGHPGVGRCDHHGGATPNGETNGRRLLADRATDQARGELERLGYRGAVANPLQRLAELAGEADAVKGLLARKVDELGELATSGKGPGGWFTAFERALDRVAALCAMLSKLDIDQRVVAAAVAAARQYGGQEVPAILDEVFDGLGLDARQRALIPELVCRALESLGNGEAGPPRPRRPGPPAPMSPDGGSVTVVGPGDAQWERWRSRQNGHGGTA